MRIQQYTSEELALAEKLVNEPVVNLYEKLLKQANRITELEAQLAALQKDAELGAAIMRARRDLPWGFTLEVNLERGNGDAVLFDSGFTDITPNFEDMDFLEKINTAIDSAIAGEAT